jgi:hypothetical protein
VQLWVLPDAYVVIKYKILARKERGKKEIDRYLGGRGGMRRGLPIASIKWGEIALKHEHSICDLILIYSLKNMRFTRRVCTCCNKLRCEGV